MQVGKRPAGRGGRGLCLSAFLPFAVCPSSVCKCIPGWFFLFVCCVPFPYRGEWKTLNLGKGQLGFTYCQVPIVYTAAAAYSITVKSSNGQVQTEGNVLSKLHSDALFHRTGEVECIEVAVPEAEFL